MPAPAFWKGYLKLSLVTCAVAMTPATTESEKVRFHTINRKTGRRVRSRYADAETGKPLDEDDAAKGYEVSDGQFITFSDEELDAVALESVRTIDIDTFVERSAVPWIYYDSPYYVTPRDKVGAEAFAVIRDAMANRDVVGISRVVLFRRERAVMLAPKDRGIVLWTLRYGPEVRDPDSYFEAIDEDKVEPKLATLIGKLIDDRSKEWSPEMVRDPMQKDLKALIAARKKKKAPPPKKGSADESGDKPSNVVNLMDALKESLDRSGRKKR